MTAKSPGLLCRIELDDLIPTSENRRKIDPKAPKFLELVASVKARDIVVPGIARVHPTIENSYDLRAGARRYAAARAAGLKDMPVIVMDLDDREALEITALENMGREDLTPIESALTIKDLVAVGKSIDEIADRFGFTAAWVRRRMKLADLHPDWMKAVADPDGDFVRWTSGHLELLARFPVNVQLVLLKEFQAHCGVFDMTVPQLERELDGKLLVLKGAPWDLADGTLVPSVGACALCPKRSSTEPGLFDALEKKNPQDKCLDASCWKLKQLAWIKRQEKEARVLNPDIVTFSEAGKVKADYKYHQAEKVKRGTPGAIEAFVKDGHHAGEVIHILPQKSAGAGGGTSEPKNTIGQARARLKAQRKDHIATRIIEAFNPKRQPEPVTKAEPLLALVAAVLGYNDEAKLLTTRGSKLCAAVWKSLCRHIDENDLHWLTDGTIDLKELTRLLGLDIKRLSADAEQQHPEPAAWKGLSDKAVVPPVEDTAVESKPRKDRRNK